MLAKWVHSHIEVKKQNDLPPAQPIGAANLAA
jgi:hypothetical protein